MTTSTLFAPTNWYGVAATTASNVRADYTAAAGKIDNTKPTAKQERINLQENARANTPEPFNSVVESGRPMKGEYAKLDNPAINNATKTNVEVNDAMKTTGTIGKVFVVGGLINSGVNIASSKNPGAQAVVEGGSWAGALQGGSWGATIGSIGGPVGSFGGGVLGSIGGGIVGSKVGQWIVNNVTTGDDSKNGFIINGAFISNTVLGEKIEIMKTFEDYVINSILANNEFGIACVKSLESLNSMVLNREQYPFIVSLIKAGKIDEIRALPMGEKDFEYLEIMTFYDQNDKQYVVTVYSSDALENDPQPIDVIPI